MVVRGLKFQLANIYIPMLRCNMSLNITTKSDLRIRENKKEIAKRYRHTYIYIVTHYFQYFHRLNFFSSAFRLIVYTLRYILPIKYIINTNLDTFHNLLTEIRNIQIML